ncbi:hypothetical protein EOA32_33900 [Mesorhizobium sp. M1A.F.Ca.ET.072.01.1.1]|nr:hypothetical protein EOA32_33900 [Mesorhizobium sp. M1A.F.Ca.ET.072.01.1.1]TIV03466.1 MAG: hypothetical protein E5W04_08335 [Mesorhizobium sp.]
MLNTRQKYATINKGAGQIWPFFVAQGRLIQALTAMITAMAQADKAPDLTTISAIGDATLYLIHWAAEDTMAR